MLEFYLSVLCMPMDNHCMVHGIGITPDLPLIGTGSLTQTKSWRRVLIGQKVVLVPKGSSTL